MAVVPPAGFRPASAGAVSEAKTSSVISVSGMASSARRVSPYIPSSSRRVSSGSSPILSETSLSMTILSPSRLFSHFAIPEWEKIM